MQTGRRFSFGFLCALPFLAIGLAGPRPLHDLPAHEGIGAVVFLIGLACAWRVGASQLARAASPTRTLALAGALLLTPWLLVTLLWTGLGPPFQATNLENQHRYILLVVNALLIAGGFIVLRDALQERGERFYSSALFAAAIPAGGLYVICIAETAAQATMGVQGDHTPFPPVLSHLYDVLEFFACALTYVSTALAALALHKAGLLGKVCMGVFVTLCVAFGVLLVLHGIEYPEISGQTAPWYTQPGVIVRIPAIPWLMPGVIAAMVLRRAGEQG